MAKRIGKLSEINTHLLIDWDTEKNLPNTPSDYTASSAKKVWWLCHICGYSWNARINGRARGTGCPYCSNKAVWAGHNDIATTHPEYLPWWNDDRPPQEFSYGSNKIINWRCPDKGHIFSKSLRAFSLQCPQCPKPVDNPLSQHLEGASARYSDSNETPADHISYNSAKRVTWTADCGHEWQAPVYQIINHDTGCPLCPSGKSTSKAEDELAEFIIDSGLTVLRRNKSLIKPFELDIYIPEKNVAIEYNGLYWHSEEMGKSRWYHFNKWKACRDAGVQLITIWEDDWVHNRPIIESMLTHKLGLSVSDRVYARKLMVSTLSTEQARTFCNKFHIQGFVQGSAYLGLTDKQGTIHAVSVWRRNRNTLYLERYCTSTIVVGGMGKLLSAGICWAESNNCSKIITFSDHCVSDGGLYAKLGFTLDTQLDPDYRYIVDDRRVHKFNYRLSRFRSDPELEYMEGLSERELALRNRIPRIWDCGKTRWIMELD